MGLAGHGTTVMSLHDFPARPPAQSVQSDTARTVLVALAMAVTPFVALVALSYPTLTTAFLGGLVVAAVYPTVRVRLRRLREMAAHSRTARIGRQAVDLRR